jgi:transcriptional regulator with XRE-family HTH domain
MTFSKKLRALREQAGLSEARLANVSGLTYASIHSYGLGRRKPSFAAVVKIAHALGVTCEAFSDCDDVAADDQEAIRPVARGARKKKRTR